MYLLDILTLTRPSLEQNLLTQENNCAHILQYMLVLPNTSTPGITTRLPSLLFLSLPRG